jgi:hypothetical protein
MPFLSWVMPEIFLDGSPSLIPRYFEKYLVEVSIENPFWINKSRGYECLT